MGPARGAVLGVFLVVAAALTGCPRGVGGRSDDYSAYTPSVLCENCHKKIYVQHRFSTHNAAYTDPLFLAQLYGDLVPAAKTDPRLAKEAETCLACHSPITWLQGGRTVVDRKDVNKELAGVTCDFCHTVTGIEGAQVGNANYVVMPGEVKYGPQKVGTDWHHAFNTLQTKSELCGVCHAAKNTHGLPVRTTYEEWERSEYARKGIQCQDCHMNAKGFLVDGVATFESGVSAQMTVGAERQRAKIFSHRFPGAHSASQMNGALQVRVEHHDEPVKPGEKVKIRVVVDNSRAGHKMPSGSPELRVLWLDVRVGLSDEGATEVLKATPGRPDQPLDVAGASPWDTDLITDVPPTARAYRAVFVDEAGQQTHDSYRAKKLVFDNRLEAGELRTEEYEYTVPENLGKGDEVHVVATLKYLPAPTAFFGRFGMPPPLPATVARDTVALGVPSH